MFKDRIRKWQLDKKIKESDVAVILHKTTERQAVGKKTAFRVRGQAMTMENIDRYLRRKKDIHKIDTSTVPSTPSHISYWTPSPSPSPLPAEDSTRMSSGFLDVQRNNLYQFRTENSRVPPVLSPPRSLLIPEQFLFNVKTYLDTLFYIRKWIANSYGQWESSGGITANTQPADIREFCSMAITMKRSGSPAGFRKTLSTAFSLVEGPLRSEHPDTLEYFVLSILLLQQSGLADVAAMLRTYIAEMSTKVLKQESLLAKVCRNLALLDGDVLEQALIEAYRGTKDTFELHLGSFHSMTLMIRVNFSEETSSDLVEQERYTRKLLIQWNQDPNVTSFQRCMISYALGGLILRQYRWREAETLGNDCLNLSCTHSQIIVALELIAYAQYHQQKYDLAERNIRWAISMIVQGWGKNVRWGAKYMILLENWLRKWERHKEADEVRAEWIGILPEDDV